MENKTIEEVIRFVSKQCSVRMERLTLSTRLSDDLGMDGNDAEEFMKAFSKQFGVDVSEFEFKRHFGPEKPFNPLLYFYWLFFKRSMLQLAPITISDLIEAAKKKKWGKFGSEG